MEKQLTSHQMMAISIPLLNDHKTITFTVKGVSMWPFFIDNHTIVTIQKEDTYHKYDIVLADFQNQYVLHRIIKKTPQGVFLRGDGSFRKEYVPYECIYGKVISYQNHNRTISYEKHFIWVWLWLHNPFKNVILWIKKAIYE